MNFSSSKKALLAGISGTALQWYDFAIFGYFAPFIATTFFPSNNSFASLLSALGVFAVGYLLAPLGSLFLGYVGDKYGRKRALTFSILAMAIPSSLIAIVPSYQSIGILAPILITFFRIMQGLVASAEFTGSAIFLVEHAKPSQKAFYGSLTSTAYSAGLILAGMVASFLTAPFMPSWGWRLGFALALFGGILIFYLRTHVDETPEFEEINSKNQPRIPFITALKERPYAIIGVLGITWITSIMTFGTYFFMGTYLHRYFNLSISLTTMIITAALCVDAVLEPFIAKLADKIGLLPVIKAGLTATFLFSLPLFYCISSGNLPLIIFAMVGLSVLIAITFAPMNAYSVSLFPKEYRYSGLGVAFNLGISLFGGPTPLFMLWLVNTTGNLTAPGWYYVFGALVGFGALRICEFSRNAAEQSQFNMAY